MEKWEHWGIDGSSTKSTAALENSLGVLKKLKIKDHVIQQDHFWLYQVCPEKVQPSLI